MTRSRLLLALAAALVALGLWFAFSDRGDPAPQTEPSTQPEVERQELAQPEQAPERTPAPAAKREPAAVGPGGPGKRARSKAAGLHGSVLEEGRKPVPDVRLELVDGAGKTLLSTTSDEKGRFAFEAVAPTAKALLSRPSREELPRLRHVMMPVTTNERVVVWVPPTGLITGTVVDAAGNPVPGAIVDTDRPYMPMGMQGWQIEEGEAPKGSFRAEADERGAFRLPYTLRGRHRLRAFHEGETGSARVDGNERGVVLRLGTHLDGAITFSGQLTDRITGAPIAGGRVWVQRVTRTPGGHSSVGVANGISDAQGRYEVQGIDVGRYRLGTMPDGFAQLEAAERDYDAGQHVVDLALMPARTVRVQVLLPDGRPAKGAKVRARDAQDRTVEVPGVFSMMGREVKVNAEGFAKVGRLPATRLTLVAVRGDLVPAARAEVDLTAGAPELVTLRMPSTRTRFARKHFFLLQGADGKPAEIDGTVVASAFEGEELLSRVEGSWRADKFVFGNDDYYDFSKPTIAVAASAGACRVEIVVPGYQIESLTLEPGAKSPTAIRLRR